jgi:hypothetical protein
MSRLGLTISSPVRLVLRSATELRSGGLLDATPDQLGITRWTLDHTNRIMGDVVIAIISGLPADQFKRVLAHEYAHAFLASTTPGSMSLKTSEGFAEVLAGSYLESSDGRLATILLGQMAANRDPTYGDGYREVRNACSQHGFHTVVENLLRGAPGRVGLG